jgi:hypothetical protein
VIPFYGRSIFMQKGDLLYQYGSKLKKVKAHELH